jgi:hypothetical protein
MTDYEFILHFIVGVILLVLLALFIVFVICIGAKIIQHIIERLDDFLIGNKKTKEA